MNDVHDARRAARNASCWSVHARGKPDGRVSTTATAKLVWAAAARGVDEELATAIEAETDWRHKYPQVRVACSGKSD